MHGHRRKPSVTADVPDFLGVSSLPYWKTDPTNQINGTDGSWFPPLYNRDFQSERLYLFSTDICRSVYAKFEAHSSVLDVPTETFSIPAEVFLNGTLNPDNAGFGTADSGVLNVAACKQGAPVFISLPHFLYAADRYANGVDGLGANALVHRTILQVEPHTGLVVSAQKRLQINVLIQPDAFIEQLQHISEVLLPAIWINESTSIDQKSADDLNGQVLRLFSITRWLSIGLICAGLLVLLTSIVFVKQRASQAKSTMLIQREINNSIASHNTYDDD